MKAIGRRIHVIEARRLRTVDQGPPVVFLSPDRWSVEDQAIYGRLRGEGITDAFCDFVERMTGKRSGPKTLLVTWRLRKDGPQ
ncbi:MAG: hypothetical protein U0Z70_20565 [Thermomicrobiales bacterium]